MLENVCQVDEEEVHGTLATVIEKDRHGEEGVFEAKEKELESIKSLEHMRRYGAQRFQRGIETRLLPQHGTS